MDTSRFDRRQKTLNPPDTDSLQYRQTNFAIGLRKDKRSLKHTKRRALNNGMIPNGSKLNPELVVFPPLAAALVNAEPRLADPSLSEEAKLGFLKDLLLSKPSMEIAFLAVSTLRTVISIEHNQPICTFVSLSLHEVLLEFCDLKYPENIVSEACWAICNLVSGAHEFTDMIAKLGGAAKVLGVVHPDMQQASEHALWVLANLSGDCPEYRQHIIGLNIIEKLKLFVSKLMNPGVSLLQTFAWLFSNLAKNSEYLSYLEASDLLGFVMSLMECHDTEVLSECLWALAYLCSTRDDMIDLLIKNDGYQYAIKNLYPSSPALKGALRIVGNFCSGTTQHTRLMLGCDILPMLHQLVTHPLPEVRKEVAWTISNIIAGEASETRVVVTFKGFRELLRTLLDTELAVRNEAMYIPYNLAYGVADNTLKLELVKYLDIIGAAIQAEKTPEFSAMMLKVCWMVFHTAETEGLLADVVRHSSESGCSAAIESLARHLNEEVSSAALHLLSRYLEQAHPEELFEVDSIPNFWL